MSIYSYLYIICCPSVSRLVFWTVDLGLINVHFIVNTLGVHNEFRCVNLSTRCINGQTRDPMGVFWKSWWKFKIYRSKKSNRILNSCVVFYHQSTAVVKRCRTTNETLRGQYSDHFIHRPFVKFLTLQADY